MRLRIQHTPRKGCPRELQLHLPGHRAYHYRGLHQDRAGLPPGDRGSSDGPQGEADAHRERRADNNRRGLLDWSQRHRAPGSHHRRQVRHRRRVRRDEGRPGRLGVRREPRPQHRETKAVANVRHPLRKAPRRLSPRTASPSSIGSRSTGESAAYPRRPSSRRLSSEVSCSRSPSASGLSRRPARWAAASSPPP